MCTIAKDFSYAIFIWVLNVFVVLNCSVTVEKDIIFACSHSRCWTPLLLTTELLSPDSCRVFSRRGLHFPSGFIISIKTILGYFSPYPCCNIFCSFEMACQVDDGIEFVNTLIWQFTTIFFRFKGSFLLLTSGSNFQNSSSLSITASYLINISENC